MTFGQFAFAIGMIASGVLDLVIRDFYSPWLPIPGWVPSRAWLACASGLVLILGGVGLAIRRTATLSARVLFAYTLLFLVVLKTPVLLEAPRIELRWLDYGQIAVLVAGALTLATASERSVRAARFLLGAALVPIGLSHFFYLKIAAPMVPAVLPFHPAWVIATGIAHIAAGVAVLAGVYARPAAILEASMITAFAVLVWLAPTLASPRDVNLWVSLIVSLAVASGVWAVASRMRPTVARPALGGPRG